MLNYDRLKELNAMPEELLKPYQLVNMAVPKELWDCLAKTLEAMVNPYDPEEERQKKKYVPKVEKKKRKKKIHNLSNDYDMSL